MLKNPLLQQAQTKVEEGVKDRASFDKIVKSGQRVIYDQKIFAELTKDLPNSEDPVADVARGVVGVVGLMAQKARGTMPQPEMAQAGMVLTLEALDFIEQAGLVKADKETLTRATQEYIENLLPSAGLSPEKMASMLGQVKQTLADPARMAQYKASLGGQKS